MASKLKNNSQILWTRLYERSLSSTESSDLASDTQPEKLALFDGIILDRPAERLHEKPFTIESVNYLEDRLDNTFLTRQFGKEQDIGQIVKKAVESTPLVDDFDTSNIATSVGTNVKSKTFNRIPMKNVLQWAKDFGNTEYRHIRRGETRFFIFEKEKNTASGLKITGSKIVQNKGQPLYSFNRDSILPMVNVVQIEGGETFSIDEQQTSDNGTFKVSHDGSNKIAYAIKSTPDWIKYGQLELKLKKVGDPGGGIRVEIREDNGGVPSDVETDLVASATIAKDDVSTSAEFVPVQFDTRLDTDRTYWIVIFQAGTDVNNRYEYSENGASSDSNMVKSTDSQETWSSVGYTFVYKWSRKESVIAQARDSKLANKYKERKHIFKEPDLIDKDIAIKLARGVLKRLGRLHNSVQSIKIKDNKLIPMPGETIRFDDPNNDFDNEILIVQEIKTELTPGKNSRIDRFNIVIGDRDTDPQELFRRLWTDLRSFISSEQKSETDEQIIGESTDIGILTLHRVNP